MSNINASLKQYAKYNYIIEKYVREVEDVNSKIDNESYGFEDFEFDIDNEDD